MTKTGLCNFLMISTFLAYSPVTFAEDMFYHYEDPSYDFIENNPYSADPAPSSSTTEKTYPAAPEHHQKLQSAQQTYPKDNYDSSDWRLPERIPSPGEKIIIVDPKVHAWGAYSASGTLIRSGLASAGAKWCSDLSRPCRTTTGSFRIQSLGDADCVSTRYPLGEGGAPMPYCMYFNGNQGLHGSNQVAAANISHGCVRLKVSDAEWIRYHFAQRGTKVIIKNY